MVDIFRKAIPCTKLKSCQAKTKLCLANLNVSM